MSDNPREEEERLREEVLRTTLLRKKEKEKDNDSVESLSREEEVKRRKMAYLAKVEAAKKERESGSQSTETSSGSKRKDRWGSDSDSGGEGQARADASARRKKKESRREEEGEGRGEEELRDGSVDRDRGGRGRGREREGEGEREREREREGEREGSSSDRDRSRRDRDRERERDRDRGRERGRGGGDRERGRDGERRPEEGNYKERGGDREGALERIEVEEGELMEGVEPTDEIYKKSSPEYDEASETAAKEEKKSSHLIPQKIIKRSSSKKIPDAVLKRLAAEKKQKQKEEEEARKKKEQEEEEKRKEEEYKKHMEEQRRREEENRFEPDDGPLPGEDDDDDGQGGPRVDRYNPLHHGCRSVEHYERLSRIDEGTYGVVFCARNRRTGEIVALKQVKMSRDAAKEGFPITALRETNVLLSLKHPNIVEVKEMVVGSSMDKVYMVMEYMDHDLKAFMDQMRQPFTTAEVKRLLLQILRGVEHMHRCWYIHRDLKTSNLLYSNSGKVTICDFGLARKYESPIRAYTHMVVTLWYRPPELLLGARKYSTAVDMWGVGCIFAELITRKPLFPGKGEVEQLTKIFEILGAPNEQRWAGYSELPGAQKLRFKLGPLNKLRNLFPAQTFGGGQAALSAAGFDLMNRLLEYDPTKRISAAEALEHEYWAEAPAPCPPEDMPKQPSRNDKYIRKAEAAAAAAATGSGGSAK